MAIRYCVIPAAGLGTRFLPLTKVLPKELLPVLDRPAVQWGVEEAVAAGARSVVMVISEGKELIASHFAASPMLERFLADRGKQEQLEAVRGVSRLAEFSYVHQPEPRGLGQAVLCAEPVVGDNPFLCLLPDDISVAPRPVLAQLVDAHERYQSPILALMRVPGDEISRYGCATVAEQEGRAHRVTAVVEKPSPAEAASDLAVMGRYVLTGDVFEMLRATAPGAGGEIQLTDAIAALLRRRPVWGVEFEGELLDVGTPAGWLATNIRLAGEQGVSAPTTGSTAVPVS
ncbi:MAG: UTP--glucose-1-phosphate uridylyltransferase [Candidatus Dormibacteria bacterium]